MVYVLLTKRDSVCKYDDLNLQMLHYIYIVQFPW